MTDLLSPDHLQILSDVTFAGFILVFLAGLMMAFNPRSLVGVTFAVAYDPLRSAVARYLP
jgi:hypothetical protein